jgi:GTP-binding protein
VYKRQVHLLRTGDKAVFFLVNKIDSPEQELALLPPFYELGVETFQPISAEHGYGVHSLLEALVAGFEQTEGLELPENTVRIAFLGRPNVGKSSMINRMLGEERMVVSDIAGTTRDSVNTLLSRDQYHYLLIDTAGIRRKGKTKDKLEKFSILKALGSLARCDIALVLIDAFEGITEQDTKVLGYTQEQGRACIILLNKWDLLAGDPKRQKQLLEEVARATTFMSFVPVLKVSAKTGKGIKRIFPEIGKVYRQFGERFATADLNRLLEAAVQHHEPPLFRGRRLKLFYTAQLGSAPPTFVVIASHPKAIHFSYQRYLTNRYREGLGLDRVPVRLIFKGKSKRKR